jgi:hypothetical protein
MGCVVPRQCESRAHNLCLIMILIRITKVVHRVTQQHCWNFNAWSCGICFPRDVKPKKFLLGPIFYIKFDLKHASQKYVQKWIIFDKSVRHRNSERTSKFRYLGPKRRSFLA